MASVAGPDDRAAPAGPAAPAVTLHVLDGAYAVARLPAGAPVPPFPAAAELHAVTRTRDELSVVCAASAVPPGATVEPGWRALAVAGPLAFALTGVLAALTVPLAAAGVPVFALSTYDTDYLLVKEADLPRASTALRAAGHTVRRAGVSR